MFAFKSAVKVAVLAGAIMAIGGNASAAVDYPTKPIQIVVPVKAGGDTDYNARVLAKFVEKYLGKPVVVTNVDGGATVTGMKQVLDAAPDGYMAVVNGTDIFVPKMMGRSPISLDSFKSVAIPLIDNTTVLAVHKESGIKNIKDLVAASKQKKMEYGMKIGATNHICGIAMGVEWGTNFKNVDVGNNAAKMTALLARQTDVINISYALAKDYFKTGEFVPLVLLGDEKNPLLSNVPLASDSGMKNLDFGKFFWIGMHPNTPDEIVNIFANAVKKATDDPEYKAKMAANFLTVKYMGPKESKDYALKFYKETMEIYKDAFVKQQ